MIKTLRITSVAAVVLAAVFFVFPAVFGIRGDKHREQLLNSAGAIEQFKEAKGGKFDNKGHETSPLVKQAEAFALYLNPPPKPTAASSVSRDEFRPRSVSAKFKLVGTSRHESQPEMSLALIDEPGKGLHWVRPSSKVGHLIIEQVRDGVVVVRDGASTFELVAERPERKSLIKSTMPPSGRITNGKSPEEEALLKEKEKALAELDAMLHEQGMALEDLESGESGSASETKAAKPAIGRSVTPVSALENMRISTREARGLDRLGRRLKNVQQKPRKSAPVRSRTPQSHAAKPKSVPGNVDDEATESNPDIIEPNSSDVNNPE
jgi:hypothetical protein